MTERQKFLGHVDITWNCWNWKGRLVNGYGQIDAGGKVWQAQRYAFYIYKNEDLKPGSRIIQICQNPRCVRPDHLNQVSGKSNSEFNKFRVYIYKPKPCANNHNNIIQLPTGDYGCGICYQMVSEALALHL